MSLLEKTIRVISPKWAAQRAAWREYETQLARGYRSATHSRLGSAAPIGATADYHLEQGYDRQKLVDRSNQLERNNPIAKGLLERNAENVVSSGIRPQARTTDAEWNQKAETLFNEWAEDKADVRGLDSFWGLQRLAQYGLMRDGDVGCVKLRSGQLQLVESLRIVAPLGREFTPRHVDGIDLDERGRPVTYHVVPRRGDETYVASTRDLSTRVKVPAKDFLFMARRTSPSQTRGEPVFSQAMEYFEHADKLLEAVVVNARMAACFGLLIKSPLPHQAPGYLADAAGTSRKRWNLEPGLVKELQPGEEVTTLEPQQPRNDLIEFMTLFGRVIGLPMGMPLELLFLDFSKTNYSSARASLLQAYRCFRYQQRFLIRALCRPVWLWKLKTFIEDGLLEARPDWAAHEWTSPGWAWVDPVKEIQAALLEVDAGFRTVADVIASRGGDFADTVQARARELETMADLGIPPVRSTFTRDPKPEGSPPSSMNEDEEGGGGEEVRDAA